MCNCNLVKHVLLDEFYYTTKLQNGLNVIVYPKFGLGGFRVSASVKFGSGNTKFQVGNSKEVIQIPAGVAHFLEHMVFYNEHGESYMRKLAYLNAESNGYTSVNHTLYNMKTHEKDFTKVLNCFLDMVFNIGFTDKNLETERTVIEQEKLESDDSEIEYASLKNAYDNEGLRNHLGDTYAISRELLVYCYNLFYHPENMLITAVGEFDIKKFITVLEEYFNAKHFGEFKTVKFVLPKSPRNMRVKNITNDIGPDVQTAILFKMSIAKLYKNTIHVQLAIDFLCAYLFGDFGKVHDATDTEFATGYEASDEFSFLLIVFEKERKSYAKVLSKVKRSVEELAYFEISNKDFSAIKRIVYACALSVFDNLKDLTEALVESYYYGFYYEEYLEELMNFSSKDFLYAVNNILKSSMVLTTVMS